jgi:hypothetical protein
MVLKLNWRFNFNSRFEFDFRKYRTIKRDVVGWLRFATSATLDLLSSFLRVENLEKSLEKPKSALKLLNLALPTLPGQPARVVGRPGTVLEVAG